MQLNVVIRAKIICKVLTKRRHYSCLAECEYLSILKSPQALF